MVIIVAYGLLISSIMLLFFKRMDYALKWLIVQGSLLALVATSMGVVTGSYHMYIAAILTLIIKAMLIPWILLRILRVVDWKEEIEKNIGKQSLLIIALGIVAFSYYITRFSSDYFSLGQGEKVLPIAISVILVGLLFMISRKNALMQVTGFITLENGIFLLGMVLTHGMPFLVEMGIFFDLLTGVIIMGMFVLRMKQQFNSLDIDRLRNLKG